MRGNLGFMINNYLILRADLEPEDKGAWLL